MTRSLWVQRDPYGKPIRKRRGGNMINPRTLSTSILAEVLLDQRKWYVDHGGSLAGYVARYGSVNDPDHYGDGGEAIHAADYAWLQALEAEAARRPVLRGVS